MDISYVLGKRMEILWPDANTSKWTVGLIPMVMKYAKIIVIFIACLLVGTGDHMMTTQAEKNAYSIRTETFQVLDRN